MDFMGGGDDTAETENLEDENTEEQANNEDDTS